MQPELVLQSYSPAALSAAKRRRKVARKESDPPALAPADVFGNVERDGEGDPASSTASSLLLAHI